MTDDNRPTNHQGSELRTVSRHIVRQLGMLNSACGDLPLSPVQAHALIEISHGAISIKKLAQILNIDKSNASRAVSHLVEKRFAHTKSNPRDSRSLLAHLTPQGRKLLQKLDHQQNIIFNEILSQLSPSETQQIETAMTLYHKAIHRSRLQQEYQLRVITPEDNAPMAEVIRTVSAEYGLTSDKGYSVADPTLDILSQQYQARDACYWVIEKDGELLGGGGIAPLVITTKVKPTAIPDRVCELQKMYFSQALRGKGFAKRLAYLALDFARELGFSSCYLETTAELSEAVKLYESIGFKHLDSHLGDTGHDACEMPMLLKL
ncbi:transcriptional regulator, MarR family with acetyltransferase activity [Shewanella psychrophila]|uniref:Transcriptional regulator, MarR family with acetyltransferase activity n=1 Tax=Shewanella psychrophila TaxID=225848 RepID=A0A1S6HQI4_9GAMM|nr:bifunctional helix-turn-helix transcriptional regulator/GNAT family N-acetyltransferase [Shewanella psychrophila]AQS37807.1 transcriptional regulator, MarR family with acetyltransferase activity [Shewanella psychrophila]